MPSTPEPRRLLILAPNWLGDAVMALPAIADLRRAFPLASLVVAARASVAAVFDLATGIDEVVTLAWHGKRGSRSAFRADVAAAARRGMRHGDPLAELLCLGMAGVAHRVCRSGGATPATCGRGC